MKTKTAGPPPGVNDTSPTDTTATQLPDHLTERPTALPDTSEVQITIRLDGATVDALRDLFTDIPDTRKPRGLRYPLKNLLTIAVLAKTSGADSVAAISRWTNHHRVALDALGLGCPARDTFYRMFRTADADLADQAMCRAAAILLGPPAPGIRPVAVDGKAQTGSKTRHSQETRTVGAYDLRGSIIGQTSVATKGGEPAALDGILTQLTSLDPGSIVFTMDAGLAGQTALNAITTHGQYWLVTIKLNRPNAHADLDSIPWADIPTTHTRTDTTHARTTTSHVKAVEFTDSRPSPIPSATTVIRIDRTTTRPSGKHSKNGKKRNRKKDTHRTTTPSTRTTIRGGKYHTTHETVYIITSIPTTPNPAQHIYNLVRGHWRIEAIHWIRDVIFGEDASTLHAGYSPRLNAALNNFVISAIRARHGPTSPIKPHTEQAAADLSYAITLFAPLKQ